MDAETQRGRLTCPESQRQAMELGVTPNPKTFLLTLQESLSTEPHCPEAYCRPFLRYFQPTFPALSPSLHSFSP